MASPIDNSAEIARAMVPGPVPLEHWLTIAPPLWCLIIGAVLLMARSRPRLQPRLAIPALGILVVLDALLLGVVLRDGPLTMVMGRWLPPFGIAFTVDITGALFALTAGISALAACVAAIRDIDGARRTYGFYPFLLFLTAGVSGAFLTGDLFNLYVWFEVMLISSFGLIVLGSEREQLDGATKYAILNLIGTTLFLAATGYTYAVFGTLNMADLAGRLKAAHDQAPLMTLTALFITAFAMKAAVWPANFWLPASYHTPRIVVGGLFASLMTKVGIYALLRVALMLFGWQSIAYQPVVMLLAVLTMLTGGLGALAQSDLRRMLGYLVISGIGVMLAGLSLASPLALSATIFYALHSMILMLALYLMAGAARDLAGSWSLHELSGLYRVQPLFSAIALCLLLSVAGLPPFSGFWPKAMLVKAALDDGNWPIAAAILVSGFLMTIAGARVFMLAFWREPPVGTALPPKRLSRSLLLPLAALTLVSIAAGLDPEPLVQVSSDAAAGLLNPAAYIQSVFPGGGPTP